LGVLLEELNLSVACRLPGGGALIPREATARAALLHLPLCLALAGACLGRGVPDADAAVGEADLAGRLRGLSAAALTELNAALRAGELRDARLLCPAGDTKFLPWNCGAELAGVATVESALRRAWPDLDLSAACWGC
ncbi:MAG TPA: hypothetical protein VGR35_11775, partial [Tepidisphaeraceae bacterium]|nr:hypothetical protein [Tepidisphaeraceae bacterium]